METGQRPVLAKFKDLKAYQFKTRVLNLPVGEF